MDVSAAPPGDARGALLELYDEALPSVYGYLLRRCGGHEAAEELTDDPTTARREDDPWDARLDALGARQTLDGLAPQHRAALTLRYVDDLPVADVTTVLGRTVHATEALLVRARREFRTAYTSGEGDDR